MRFVLVHSPLVGPSTWEPVAGALRASGHGAEIPRLAAPDGGSVMTWRDCVASARDALGSRTDAVVLVGHSGAGLLLPAIAEAVDRPTEAMIFVDSGLPASSGATELAPAPFRDQLRVLAADGRLPPWSEWWGEDAMRDLVPDDDLRAALEREMPSLPLSYFEDRVPSPAGWERIACSYLLLSDGYRDDADDARRRGWPVESIEGAGHLHIAVAPAEVAGALIGLAAR